MGVVKLTVSLARSWLDPFLTRDSLLATDLLESQFGHLRPHLCFQALLTRLGVCVSCPCCSFPLVLESSAQGPPGLCLAPLHTAVVKP